MLLINLLKMRGPNANPCGTQYLETPDAECQSISTHWIFFRRQLKIDFRIRKEATGLYSRMPLEGLLWRVYFSITFEKHARSMFDALSRAINNKNGIMK